MALTKPISLALQIIGAVFVLGGVVRLFTGSFTGAGIIGLAFGIALLWAGRQNYKSP